MMNLMVSFKKEKKEHTFRPREKTSNKFRLTAIYLYNEMATIKTESHSFAKLLARG